MAKCEYNFYKAVNDMSDKLMMMMEIILFLERAASMRNEAVLMPIDVFCSTHQTRGYLTLTEVSVMGSACSIRFLAIGNGLCVSIHLDFFSFFFCAVSTSISFQQLKLNTLLTQLKDCPHSYSVLLLFKAQISRIVSLVVAGK